MGLNFETKFENFTINVMTVRATLQVAISLLPTLRSRDPTETWNGFFM